MNDDPTRSVDVSNEGVEAVYGHEFIKVAI